MGHPGRHEQPIKTLHLRRRNGSILAIASKKRDHAFVIVDTVLRRDQLVVPTVILQQLATTLPELLEIWIGCVEQRSKLGFSPEEGLITRRIRELE